MHVNTHWMLVGWAVGTATSMHMKGLVCLRYTYVCSSLVLLESLSGNLLVSCVDVSSS